MTAPAGGPPGSSSGRPPAPRWRTAGLVAVVVGLVAVVAAFLSVAAGGPDEADRTTPAPRGNVVPGFDLAGEWSGTATLARCAGLDGCERTRSVTVTIECAGQSCRVTPFDGWGSPPLRVTDGGYRATGLVPAEAAPTCEGVPASTATWRLELTVLAGRLVGSYAESTLQSFNCGATGAAWDVVLERG